MSFIYSAKFNKIWCEFSGHGFHKAAVKTYKDKKDEGERRRGTQWAWPPWRLLLTTDDKDSPCNLLLLTFMLSMSCPLWESALSILLNKSFQFNYFRILKGSTSKQKLLISIKVSKNMLLISKLWIIYLLSEVSSSERWGAWRRMIKGAKSATRGTWLRN